MCLVLCVCMVVWWRQKACGRWKMTRAFSFDTAAPLNKLPKAPAHTHNPFKVTSNFHYWLVRNTGKRRRDSRRKDGKESDMAEWWEIKVVKKKKARGWRNSKVLAKKKKSERKKGENRLQERKALKWKGRWGSEIQEIETILSDSPGGGRENGECRWSGCNHRSR